MTKKWLWAGLTVVAMVVSVAALHAQLGRVLKGGAVVLLVKQFGKQINDGINAALLNRKWEHKKTTKVVPIVSIGKGLYVGAAQVVGEEEDVQKVEAVAQLELDLPGKARARVLIPVDSVGLDPTRMSRVYGVGVSAVIDLRL